SGAGTWLAAGRLVLDRDDLTAMLTRADGYAEARAIVVHELAHVLGLDHVQDPGELMNPTTSTRTDLGPGDLAGLALVGQVACEE
ncbi:MAG: matrixin family metalloprotease, partial [Cellulomonadaceae bacterium]|nr:matrixin family metalloprotease [Cellulomonadaceae bacterium]